MDITVTHDAAGKRYEAHEGGSRLGLAAYVLADRMIVFTHTEVDPAHEGRGVGSALARAALDDARARGLAVMPLCPFIKGWIQRHPEYADLQFNAPPSTATD
ncbi:GNAT family N-acetyltransferase [Kineococcus sp. T13]|uniref:GNAT family N-acetyltransferase n=1 Tax=Kineococcus vitellinus TaxID=2696565 RepID=UPI0014136D3D|nr:GNAT family N-acetyltransferase [Kineococcus vitellinus]NAZ74295.1 GNAT family N-acetyltransferase [Kineococcus vitellinus]